MAFYSPIYSIIVDSSWQFAIGIVTYFLSIEIVLASSFESKIHNTLDFIINNYNLALTINT
jgi:hypothetical protein